MTKEDKELLLKDLCARLPYGIKCYEDDVEYPFDIIGITTNNKEFVFSDGYERSLEQIKPYLRPMSSMTEEEREELKEEQIKDEQLFVDCIRNHPEMRGLVIPHFATDWCNKNHFDYRGLIEKGLAIEVNESNNPYKE